MWRTAYAFFGFIISLLYLSCGWVVPSQSISKTCIKLLALMLKPIFTPSCSTATNADLCPKELIWKLLFPNHPLHDSLTVQLDLDWSLMHWITLIGLATIWRGTTEDIACSQFTDIVSSGAVAVWLQWLPWHCHTSHCHSRLPPNLSPPCCLRHACRRRYSARNR